MDDNLMKPSDWLREKLLKGEKLLSKEAYERFLKETNSNASRRSMKRAISKIKKKLKEAGILAVPPSAGSSESYKVYDEEDTSYETEEKRENYDSLNYEKISRRITNVEEYIEFLKLDLDKWEVRDSGFTKWDIGIKVGSKENAHVEVTPLFRVFFKASPKVINVPRFEFPEPTVFNLSIKNPEIPKPKQDGFSSALILSDAQISYVRDDSSGYLSPIHDRPSMLLAIAVAKDLQPNFIIFNGDMFDLSDWSTKYTTSPAMTRTLKPAVAEFGYYVGLLKSVSPKSRMIFIEGNHENRMIRAIIEYMPFAYGLISLNDVKGYDVISIPAIFGFESLGIEWIGNYPNGKFFLNDFATIEHGNVAIRDPGKTAAKMLEERLTSVNFGHIHRIEGATKTIDTPYGKKSIYSQTYGCMCSIHGDVPSNGSEPNWQKGFGVNYFNDSFSVPVPIRVEDEKCIFNSKMYSINEKEYVKSLVQNTGWKVFLDGV